jgi:alpha-tubulin suppressor-like RCC1 family protein
MVAPAAPPAPHRSSHSAATSAAAVTPSGKPTAPAYDLFVWGGAKSMWSRATSTSAVKNSPLTTVHLRPTSLASPDGTGFQDVSFGHKHAAFITGSGDLYTYGVGPALGLGTLAKADTPTKVEGLPQMVEVRCGRDHTIALSVDGEVFTFGRGNTSYIKSFGYSPLGTGSSADAPRPVRVNLSEKVAMIASGSLHNTVVTRTGKLFSWGNGANGRLGLGSSASFDTPQLLEAVADKEFVQISCGSSFNTALTKDGQLYTWGRNEKGQCGVGVSLTLDQYSMEPAPVKVAFVDDVDGEPAPRMVTAKCAYKHTLSIDSDGHMWTWGQGKWLKPNLMTGDDGWMTSERFVDCSGGENFSAAVMADGSLVTWGEGSSGCLGHGDSMSRKDPQSVRGFGPDVKRAGVKEEAQWMGKVAKVLAGHNHCAVLTTKK